MSSRLDPFFDPQEPDPKPQRPKPMDPPINQGPDGGTYRKPPKRERTPQPLARCTLTFNSPTEPGSLLTLEVQVFGDLPGQLDWGDSDTNQQAGWFSQDVGGMVMAYRLHMG